MSLAIADAMAQVGAGADGFTLSIGRLEIPAGGCAMITGASGVGKTSVLECCALARALQSAGRFSIASQDVLQAALGGLEGSAAVRRALVAYVPQSGGLAPFLRASDNALATLRSMGRGVDAAVLERLHQLAARLGVANRLNVGLSALSGGERRRVGLLRALVARPPLIVADEPTSGLDAPTARVVADLLLEASAKGAAVLIATHDAALFRSAGFSELSVGAGPSGIRRLQAAAA